jgi:beta-mannosidase
MYLANVREKVARFRNHPCIALWCGRNEGNPSPAPVADGIAAILKELDPARLYQPSSTDGRGVKSGGPYSWRPPAAYYTYATTGRNAEPFKTEIGSASIPTLESIYGMMPKADADQMMNDDWAEHDLAKGADNGNTYRQTLAARYGPINSLPEFVRKAQLADYEAFRALYEGRFAKLFAPTSAVITWMSNPAQPSTTWQIYSYDLEPFASFFGAKKACEPIHVQMNQNDFHVMVINNTPTALEGLKTRVRVYNLDGTMKYEQTTPVASAKASAATDAGAIAFPADVSAVHFVKVELRDAQDKLLSDNFYWRGVNENNLTALDTLPTAALDAAITRHDADGKCLLDVSLTNSSKNIALMAHLQLRKQSTNMRVLPVFYSDNYVSLLPGESKTITIEAAAKDLGGDKPLVTLDGWNVTTQDHAFADAAIALNTPAIVPPTQP